MATTTRLSLEALINRVGATPGFKVRDYGNRWQVINTEGGAPVHIPKRPPQSNTLKAVYDTLAGIGWNDFNAAQVAEDDRQARLMADRIRNEQRMQEAIERAERATKRLEMATNLAEDAKPVAGGQFREEVVVVDLAYARELLELNEFFREHRTHLGHTNRPVNPDTVDRYAKQMLRREFPLTHQGLAFNVEGELVDGQQRLLALVKAATEGFPSSDPKRNLDPDPTVTFTTKITWDMPVEVMRYIDIGRNRGRADLLALNGEVNRHLLGTVLNLLYLYFRVKPENWYGTRMATDEMFDILEEHPGVRDAVRMATVGRVQKVIAASSVAAFAYVAGRVYRDAPLREFLYGLGSGEDLTAGDPRLALKNMMERIHRDKRKKIDNIEQFMLLLKAWNYWLMGRPLKEIAIKAGESFPWPIERD